MQPYICGRFVDRYLVVCRTGGQGAVINEHRYLELVSLSENSEAKAPGWLISVLSKLDAMPVNNRLLSNLIFIRKPGTIGFAKASYEITEACNFSCKHCYLGDKNKAQLTVENKKGVLNLIERAGCIWLQITGGEPLLNRDFIETYVHAQSLGFLVVLSTNGSLLLSPQIARTLQKYPPWRLTMSLYGATEYSYEALTQVRGSAKMVIGGLCWAKEKGLRVRVNIIVTDYNKNEISEMIGIVEDLGFDYYVFDKITPTINGDRAPLEVMADEFYCRRNEDKERAVSKTQNSSCLAGKTFFHIDTKGALSVCKIARSPNINLLKTGVAGFTQLSDIADEILRRPPECHGCENKQLCKTCAPILSLYRSGGTVPAHVCRTGQYYKQGEKQ